MEKENVNKIFNYCIDELKYMFMFMNSDQNYHYFKHQLTREYIKIPIIDYKKKGGYTMFYRVNKIDELMKNFEITTLKDQKKIMEIIQNIQECLRMQLEMNKTLRLRIEKLEEDNES